MELGPNWWAVQGANERGRVTRLEASNDGRCRQDPENPRRGGESSKQEEDGNDEKERVWQSEIQQMGKREKAEVGELKNEY